MSQTRPPLIRPGEVLDGKWSIGGLLGEGGMGAVFDATHTRNGLSVAVKILLPEHARDEGVRKRFLQEGYAANRVNHSGTVRVLDDGLTENGLAYLVMEKLDGQTLDQLADANGGALPIERVLDLADKALEIVAAAHEKGIVHRDLKPENMFLMQDGNVKILDFGIAQVRELTTQTRLTVTGIPMGTPAFMPPEQALAKWDQVDARSDVFALGATMWTLLTGRLVHEGTTVPETLVLVSTRQAVPSRSVLPTLTPAVADVIDRALRFDRTHRWQDARMMLRALREARALGQSGGVPSFSGTIRLDTGSGSFAFHNPPTPAPESGPTLLSGQAAGGGRPLPHIEVRAATPVGKGAVLRTEAPVSSSSRKTYGDSLRNPKPKANLGLLIAGILVGIGVATGAAFFVASKIGKPSTAAPVTPTTGDIVAKPSEVGTQPTPEISPTVSLSGPAPTVSLAPPETSASAASAKPAGSSRPAKKPTATPTASAKKPAFMGFE